MHIPFTSVFTTGLLMVASMTSVVDAQRAPRPGSIDAQRPPRPVRPTTTTSAAPAGPTISADEKAALQAHNTGRATKGLAPLQWDVSLVKSAQACADKIASTGNFAHCQSGENLYGQSGGTGNVLVNGVTAWLNEAPLYKGEKIPDGNFAGYGHYTQVMWKSTARVGMAQAKGANGWTYVVAHYDPAGNL